MLGCIGGKPKASYEIDLAAMTQRSTKTGFTRKVARKKSDAAPRALRRRSQKEGLILLAVSKDEDGSSPFRRRSQKEGFIMLASRKHDDSRLLTTTHEQGPDSTDSFVAILHLQVMRHAESDAFARSVGGLSAAEAATSVDGAVVLGPLARPGGVSARLPLGVVIEVRGDRSIDSIDRARPTSRPTLRQRLLLLIRGARSHPPW